MHLQVMTDPAFPFPAIGSVHLTNTITAHRAIAVGETVEVTVHPENLRPHAKGRTVDFVTQVTSDDELVGRAARRTCAVVAATTAGAPPAPVFDDVAPPAPSLALAGDLGRRYAAVSGDRNPIHLYPLTAKAFGFKRQIAHGMWSKARCVAALENRLPDAVTVEVAFRKPIFLPGRVAFAAPSRPTPATRSRSTDPRSGAPHLQGRPARAPVGEPLAPSRRRDRARVGPARACAGPQTAAGALPHRALRRPRQRRRRASSCAAGSSTTCRPPRRRRERASAPPCAVRSATS